MSRVLTLVVGLAVCLGAIPAFAGNNFGATAVLSWNAMAQVSNLETAPTGTTPLYLLIEGAPDVRTLAVELQWSPNDLVGPCYYMVPADTGAAACAWTSYPLSPPGVVDGDSTYTWQINFNGTGRSCVMYMIGGDHCGGRAATFCLMSIKVVDSNGEVDDLEVLGNATILGGTENGCPVVARDVFPHTAILGRANTFTIQGRDLDNDTQIELVNGGAAVVATSVSVAGDTMVTAAIEVPSTFAGSADIVVSSGGASDTLRGHVFVADSTAGTPPVWRLDLNVVDGSPRAAISKNEFANPAYNPTFPISRIMLRNFVDHSKVSEGRVSASFQTDVAFMNVDSNGRATAEPLAFTNSAMAAIAPDRAVVNMLAPDNAEGITRDETGKSAVPLRVRLRESERVLGWEQSPDDAWQVIHTPSRTLIVKSGQSAPLLELPARSFYGGFSRDGQRFAAVSKTGREQRWFVVGAAGNLVREGAPIVGEISQLQLSSDGRVLTFYRQEHTSVSAKAIAIDLQTGAEMNLALPDGTRYYSGDGQTMLVLTPHPGALYLYDVSNPLSPVEVSRLQTTSGAFLTGAVAGDGSLIAVQIIETIDNPGKNLNRVVAYDRAMNERAVVVTRIEAQGLQFEGKFLFVGTQRHPTPAWLAFRSTTSIEAFDLTEY